jgi:hypothetical protein
VSEFNPSRRANISGIYTPFRGKGAKKEGKIDN